MLCGHVKVAFWSKLELNMFDGSESLFCQWTVFLFRIRARIQGHLGYCSKSKTASYKLGPKKNETSHPISHFIVFFPNDHQPLLKAFCTQCCSWMCFTLWWLLSSSSFIRDIVEHWSSKIKNAVTQMFSADVLHACVQSDSRSAGSLRVTAPHITLVFFQYWDYDNSDYHRSGPGKNRKHFLGYFSSSEEELQERWKFSDLHAVAIKVMNV